MKKNKLFLAAIPTIAMVGILLTTSQSLAVPSKANEIASVNISKDSFSMDVNSGSKNVTVTYSGPNGFYSNEFSGKSGSAVADVNVSQLKDGVYKYEYTAPTNQIKIDFKQNMNQGRENNTSRNPVQYVSAIQSGHFRVENGEIVDDELVEKGEEK